MRITQTGFDGLVVIEPNIFNDERGYFFEAYNQENWNKSGLPYHFVQDNQSSSVYGVVRGLHYQLNPYAQTKLVRVLAGEILDVVVDLRKDSSTYGQYFSISLTAENKKQLLVPKGFAHGFSVLSAQAEVLYKCDSLYKKEAEAGILYNDYSLNIDWQLPADKMLLSPKDILLPTWDNIENNF